MSQEQPFSDGGRDRSGRFAVGNKGGPGNPHARRTAKLRAVLLETITPEDVAAATRALVEQAKSGDLAAIKELLDRTIGKAKPYDDAQAPGKQAIVVVADHDWNRASAVEFDDRDQCLRG